MVPTSENAFQPQGQSQRSDLLLNNTLGGFTSFWLGSVQEKTARLPPKGVFQKVRQKF